MTVVSLIYVEGDTNLKIVLILLILTSQDLIGGRQSFTDLYNPALSGVQALRTRDNSDARHLGTSAKLGELSVKHIGTGAEVSRHICTDVL